jgi:hypothetical protein
MRYLSSVWHDAPTVPRAGEVNRQAARCRRPAYVRRVPSTWDPGDPQVLRLPSGRLVRGQALRRPRIATKPPDLAVHLLGAPISSEPPWETRWVRWPDFRLPADDADAYDALAEAWRRSATDRVEVSCGGGRGRTGTALACLSVLDGVPPAAAVAFVRAGYDPRAVETPWQRRYVRRFDRLIPPAAP